MQLIGLWERHPGAECRVARPGQRRVAQSACWVRGGVSTEKPALEFKIRQQLRCSQAAANAKDTPLFIGPERQLRVCTGNCDLGQ